MESFGGSEVQSGGYGGRGLEIADEHHQLGQESGGALPSAFCGNSFTVLLGLSPGQATELLHSTGAGGDCLPADFAGNVLNRHRIIHQIPYAHTLNCSLPFPSNAALIERAAKYSVFAAAGGSHDSLYTISAPYNSSGGPLKMKSEPADSNSNPNLTSKVSDATFMCQIEKTSKQKEREEKGKGSVKKIKTSAKDYSGDGEKLPYVHVRARRGEATDSHSLAELARREKINARMKLLQELVPGCNKISGTALVLDQIINHVQNLQRQVEYLSMKLAAVNPTTDFNLDSLFAAGNGSPMDGNFQSMMMPLTWPEIQINCAGREGHQQWLSESLTQPDWAGDEDQCNLITPENSLLSYDSSGNSVSSCPSQRKMELGNAS